MKHNSKDSMKNFYLPLVLMSLVTVKSNSTISCASILNAHTVTLGLNMSIPFIGSKLLSWYTHYIDSNMFKNNPEKLLRYEEDLREIKKFVINEAEVNGLNNKETIQVQWTQYDRYFPMAVHNTTLFIHKDMRYKFLEAKIIRPKNAKDEKITQQTPLYIQKKFHKELRAMIQHELGHIKYQDTQKGLIVGTLLMATTYGIFYYLNKKCSSLRSSLFASALYTISSAASAYAINRLLSKAYMRHREKEADEQIPNIRDYLEGAITTISRHLSHEIGAINEGRTPNTDGNIFAYIWYENHPRTRWRLNRFKERLAYLDYPSQAKEKEQEIV